LKQQAIYPQGQVSKGFRSIFLFLKDKSGNEEKLIAHGVISNRSVLKQHIACQLLTIAFLTKITVQAQSRAIVSGMLP
jgi:hypothetical protein